MGKMRKKSGVNLCNLVVAKFHKDERAQSMALGFVIIMGILLTSAIIFLSMEIPKQTKILEAEHAAKVPQDFAELVSAIDEVALSDDETASATCAFGLTSKSVSFVGVRASGGALTFDNDSERFECIAYAPEESIVIGGGYWNSTLVNFSYYDDYDEDVFHVSVSDTSNGAELELVTLQDKTYDSGGDVYLAGEYWYNNFTVTGGTTLRTSLLTIHAMNISIDSGSSINADGGGMTGGRKDQDGQGPGRGNNSITNYSAGGGGGGYGGLGGEGGFSYYGTGGEGGSSYGNVTNKSVDAGSGGAGGSCGHEVEVGGGCYDGGNGGSGGGTIHLDAKTVIIAGILLVNGEAGAGGSWAPDSAGGGGGGGSGGSVFIEGYNVSIHGNIYAKGGAGGDGRSAWHEYPLWPENNGGGGGGGAGGRIKVFFNNIFDTPGGLSNHVEDSGGAEGKAENAHWSPDVVDGGDGSPGTCGTNNSTQYAYNITIPRYSTGYLISNVTAAKSHIGHDAGEDNDTSMLRYGAITWTETRPSGTGIYMKVRTSTNANMSGAMDWKDCSEVANGTAISDLPSVSDGHRYIQWHADLYTLERSRTPILHSVNISYEYGLPVIADCKGSIEFSSHYFSLPNYKLVYEHGATLKNQTSGEFMLHTPPITISKSDTTTALKISSVNLTGNDDTASGVFSSAVKASYKGADLLTGGLDFHNITLNITTAYPTAWRRWFNQTCKDAGLVYGAAPGNYIITGTGNPLRIIFYGNDTNPVNLWLKESEVEIEIEG